MQSIRSVRNHSAYTGALNIRRLHSLATGNAKVFLRKGEKAGVNTAVHILLDASGSMNGKPIALAVKACFAVASALQAYQASVWALPPSPAILFRIRRNSKDTGKPLLPSCCTVRSCIPGSR